VERRRHTLLSDGGENRKPTSVLYLSGLTREVAAVAEPQSYALMLAGLAFIGFVARRKNGV
jgi:hypothetical protein